MALELSSENFESEVLQSAEVCLVDFWAPWCGPCKVIAPVIDEISEEFSGKIKVGKVNVDESPQLASEYGIMSIPTMMIFKAGKKQDTIVGVVSKESLINTMSAYI